MGVEGKDKAKVLEAGAAALSGQLGRTVRELRKNYGLSLADLSTQSGVAKSIISQIERNETNPTLTTIWRLAHALDVSIESVLHGAEEGPFLEHSCGEDADPGFRRWPLPPRRDRLAEDRRLAAMVRFPCRTGRCARFGSASARFDRMPVGARRRTRGRGRRCRRRPRAPARPCAIAATGRTGSATSARSRRMRRWYAF